MEKSIINDVIKIQSRSMSDPTLSDNVLKNIMALVWRLWTTLDLKVDIHGHS